MFDERSRPHLCQDLMGITKQAYLGGTPPILPLWGEWGAGGVPAYIKAPHWEHGGVFGGAPPRYIRFDPPLKS